jgi:hypothetical protein
MTSHARDHQREWLRCDCQRRVHRGNDQLNAQAILNEIHGKKHDGTRGSGIPAVFGMNFHAVSVGQEVASDNADPARCNLADGNALHPERLTKALT